MTEETLARLAHGQLTSEDASDVIGHLRSCVPCASLGRRTADPELAHLRASLGTVGKVVEERHLDPETELVPYVDGTLGPVEREIVETHLDDCAMCTAEVADLHAAVRPAPRRRWLGVVAAVLFLGVLVAVILALRPSTLAPTPPPVVRRQPETTTTATAPTPTATRYADPEWEHFVADAISNGDLPRSKRLEDLQEGADILRGTSATPDAIAPAGIVVEEARPTFTWPQRLNGNYDVFIFDGDRQVAQSGSLSKTSWTPTTDLPRGRMLTWQVEISRDDALETIPAPPAPPARFLIVSESEERELRRAREAKDSDELLLAVLYARAGLRRQSEEALRKAAAHGDAAAAKLLARRQP
ncbi:MAG: zf-HC2 domain-containing protein [Acidobacteria bacterium]|nr:zf-HC2 domain-containing protein [Acidobacteriota bacterium]